MVATTNTHWASFVDGGCGCTLAVRTSYFDSRKLYFKLQYRTQEPCLQNCNYNNLNTHLNTLPSLPIFNKISDQIQRFVPFPMIRELIIRTIIIVIRSQMLKGRIMLRFLIIQVRIRHMLGYGQCPDHHQKYLHASYRQSNRQNQFVQSNFRSQYDREVGCNKEKAVLYYLILISKL